MQCNGWAVRERVWVSWIVLCYRANWIARAWKNNYSFAHYALITTRQPSLLISPHAFNYFHIIHITRYIFAIKLVFEINVHTHTHKHTTGVVLITIRKIARFPTFSPESIIISTHSMAMPQTQNTGAVTNDTDWLQRALSWNSVHCVKLATGHCLPSPTTLQDKRIRFSRCRAVASTASSLRLYKQRSVVLVAAVAVYYMRAREHSPTVPWQKENYRTKHMPTVPWWWCVWV